MVGGIGSYSAWKSTLSQEVYCRGQNYLGQLGDGTNADSPTVFQEVLASAPDPIAGSIGVGEVHTCAVKADGTVDCWGVGDPNTELGLGPIKRNTAQPSGVKGARAVSLGTYHSCAIKLNNTVVCWGGNENGALGTGTLSNYVTGQNYVTKPLVPVVGLTDVKQLALAEGYSCALRKNGAVLCWGGHPFGLAGNGSGSNLSSPTAVKDTDGVTDLVGVQFISARFGHTCAVRTNGAALCWGMSQYGQLGSGVFGTPPSPTPQAVAGTSTYKSIAAGLGQTCAIKTDETVECWGAGSQGELGNGANAQQNTPVVVQDVGGGGVLGNVKMIAAGYQHTCAVRGPDNHVVCWGKNQYGQLGNGKTGTVFNSNVPVNVSGGLTQVNGLGAGYDHTCAHTTSGAVMCWGHGIWGQLGQGAYAHKNTPTAVANAYTTAISIPPLKFWK